MTRGMTPPGELDRAYGAMLGLAIGDALGMPTQGFTREDVVRRWPAHGGLLDGFEAAPGDNPISAGMAAARVTDDTDQAVILGRLLVDGVGSVDPYAFAAALAAWQVQMQAAGSLDLLGPSTKRALEALAAGTPPDQSGRAGTTNGAAMRVAPVGIATSPEPLAALVDAVEDASRVTHHTSSAIAGAAGVAAAVSAGVSGWSYESAVAHALSAARLGSARGERVDEPDVADRIEAAISLARAFGHDPAEASGLLDLISARVGTDLVTYESVPVAFALAAAYGGDIWLACRAAASVGGDSDTIAAMTGAMLGAIHGASALPPGPVAAMLDANPDLDLRKLSCHLLALRSLKEDA